MHEYSIVQNLLDLCEQNVKQNNATKVNRVVVGIGELSSVEPQLLKTAFDAFKFDTIADEALLETRILELKAKCLECDIEFKPSRFNFLCPTCGGAKTDLISGDELLLLSLEIE